jgi:inosose dehydratase
MSDRRDEMVKEGATEKGARSAIVVANAPCSYGAFELTVGGSHVPEPKALLDAVAAAGYDGIDLGPPGYLGTEDVLAKRLRARGLGLAGGYLALPFSDPDELGRALATLDALLDVFDRAGTGALEPRPTLADAGSPERAARPGRAALDRSIGLDERRWRLFADGLARAVDRCRGRGYEPTFHHHTATYVEARWEVERVLELSDVGLCLDTGHLILGAGDPVAAVTAWGERINHVHLKDARLDVLEGIVADAASVIEIWKRRAFCPLGEGDLDVDGVLAVLDAIGYSGWVVVEQDIVPEPGTPLDRAVEEQRRNREYLRARGL